MSTQRKTYKRERFFFENISERLFQRKQQRRKRSSEGTFHFLPRLDLASHPNPHAHPQNCFAVSYSLKRLLLVDIHIQTISLSA